MQIVKITIENYRSIREIPFQIVGRDDGSFTYGLIGINEAGKSSILKAIGLKDGLVDAVGTKLPLSKDFRAKVEIRVTFTYKISQTSNNEIYKILNKRVVPPDSEEPLDDNSTNVEDENKQTKDTETNEITEPITNDLLVKYQVSFTTASSSPVNTITIYDGENPIHVNKQEFEAYFIKNVHKTIFWTAEDRYLISKPINIEQFVADTSISIPLRNCFLLSSIQETEIKQKLDDALEDTTDCEELELTLGESVTKHIKSAWPNHPIKITFKIMDGHINFHVKDVDTKGKAQTSDMRSDGFKQFVSFLLTIAAENRNEELENTILLLDEPETHLHPKAQEYLLTQLIGITKNNKNNLVFFATHSNYMIDKNDLGRYYRVSKTKDEKNEEYTQATQFNTKQTSYAEVSYDVFDVLDEQYHNELYDKLRDWFVKEKNSKETDESKHLETIGINSFDDQYLKQDKKADQNCPDTSKPKISESKVTLPTFIRNCIHYPTNKDQDFETKLKSSIELLRQYVKEDIEAIESKR